MPLGPGNGTLGNPTTVLENGRLSPDVSIVVPVFNDEERLKACLDRLAGQTYPRAKYEVIVADNGSDRSVQPLVSAYPGMRAVEERRPGSYAARNAGLAVAEGEIIAFTDSDCLPRENWVERGVGCFTQHSDVGLVGGRMVQIHRRPGRLSKPELYQELLGFPQQRYVEQRHFAVTANAFTRRSVIDDVGTFNSELKSSGDLEWGTRIFDAGYRLLYASDAVVEHPSRSLIQLAIKRVRLTGGKFTLSQLNGDAPPSLLDEFRRMREKSRTRLTTLAPNPLMQDAGNRLAFQAIEQLLNVVELAEFARLRWGGRPTRR